MRSSAFLIQNRAAQPIRCMVEPECWEFDVEIGQTIAIRGDYKSEPPTIQFWNLSPGRTDVAVSLFPGDGKARVETLSGDIIIEF